MTPETRDAAARFALGIIGGLAAVVCIVAYG